MKHPRLKFLQQKIGNVIDSNPRATANSRNARIMSAVNVFAKELADWAFVYARNDDDYTAFQHALEDEGWLQQDGLNKPLLPVQAYLDDYGKDLNLQIIDSKKLVQRYRLANNENIKVQTWFNASVLPFKDKLYMAYRIDASPWTENTRVCMCELSSDYDVVAGSNWIMPLPTTSGFAEDPRLFLFRDELWMTYTDGNAIYITGVDPEHQSLYLTNPIRKPMNIRMEKNWTFFEHEGVLYCNYKINPHTIFEMNGEGAGYEKLQKQYASIQWDWGSELRGGSCPILYQGNYYAFFHSHSDFPEDLKNQLHRQYHMGVYVFEAAPPFKVIGVSKEPIMSGRYMGRSVVRGGDKHCIVFPCGSFMKDGTWVVSCGLNDYEIGILELSHEKLIENINWF